MEHMDLNERSIRAMEEFLDQVELSSFRQNLRDVFLHYLAEERSQLPPHHGRFIEDMMLLLRMLDGMG